MTRPASDQALTGRLFEAYGSAIRRYFRRFTGRPELADELTQDVFVRVLRGAPSFEPRDRDAAWVFRIARNVLHDYHRAGAQSGRGTPVTEADAFSGPAQGVALELQRALSAINEADREAFLLAEIGGLTYREISALTASTAPAVRSRIYRARQALRNALTPPAPLTAIRSERNPRDV